MLGATMLLTDDPDNIKAVQDTQVCSIWEARTIILAELF
jgi:hypothetical protein